MGKAVEVRAKNTIKLDGAYHKPGDIVEVPEELARQLVLISGAAEYVGKAPAPPSAPEAPESPDSSEEPQESNAPLNIPEAIDELMNVEGVSKGVAQKLIDEGITSIVMLKEKTVEDLSAIKGIGKKTAKKIVKDAAQFEISEE